MNKEVSRRSRRRPVADKPVTDKPAAETADSARTAWQAFATLRRYQFVMPLCAGKAVLDRGDLAEGKSLVAQTASSVMQRDDGATAEVVLSLGLTDAADLAARLPELGAHVADGGILAVAVTGAPGHSGSVAGVVCTGRVLSRADGCRIDHHA